MTAASRLLGGVALVLLAGPSVAHTRAQVTRAAIEVSGVVVAADDPTRPIRQAVITLTPIEAPGTAAWWEQTIGEFPATLTDDDGRFRFVRVPAGRYRVSAAKPAFLTTEFGAMRPGAPGTAIAVADGARVADISIRLVRGAVITGVLRNPDGLPAANVAVSAMVAGSQGSGGSATTDDRGVYRIFGLPAGEYVISSWLVSSFSPGEQSTSVSAADVDAALQALERRYGVGRGAGSGGLPSAPRPSQAVTGAATPPFRLIQVAPTFYPGTIDRASATAVRVTAAETRDNVDFQFVIAGTVEVAGVVRLPDGRPAAGAVVSIDLGRTTRAGTDGAFRIGGVSPGHQTLSARVSGLSSALAAGQPLTAATLQGASSRETALWALDDVDVPAGGLSNLSVNLRPGMTLSGRAVFDATSLALPRDLASVQIRLTTSEIAGLADVQRDGSFNIRGIVPGPSQITGTVAGAPSPGWWLRSAVLDGRDLLDLPLEFGAATGDVSGVVLTFTDRHTEIAGTLETPAGAPATDYVVAVLPPDRRLWQSQARRLAVARPATDGHFSFHDLPPGAYVIVALTDLDPMTWRQSAFLESLIGAGVQITLAEGGRVVQNLRIAK